jgi:hypothetical protein
LPDPGNPPSRINWGVPLPGTWSSSAITLMMMRPRTYAHPGGAQGGVMSIEIIRWGLTFTTSRRRWPLAPGYLLLSNI